MSHNKFIQLWREWQKLSDPTSNFRGGHVKAPTYSIECALDHIISRIHSLGSGFIDKKGWDFAELAYDEILELGKVKIEIDQSSIQEIDKDRFRQYISISSLLLDELSRSYNEEQLG